MRVRLSQWTESWVNVVIMSDIHRALKQHFGFDKFRSQQQEDVVKAVVKGEKNTAAVDYYGIDLRN